MAPKFLQHNANLGKDGTDFSQDGAKSGKHITKLDGDSAELSEDASNEVSNNTAMKIQNIGVNLLPATIPLTHRLKQ